MNGTSIGGEIGGFLVGSFEEPEQIVGELWGHVVDVNPKGKGERVVRIGVQPVHLGAINGVVELVDEILLPGARGVVGNGGWRGGEEAVEGDEEGSFGIGNADIGGRKRGRAERREREEDEEERESEKEEEQSGSRFGSWNVLSGHCYARSLHAKIYRHNITHV